MASFVYNEFARASAAGEIDLDAQSGTGTGGGDIRARLCMGDSTCATDNDGIAVLTDFGDIDVCDSTLYEDIALESETVTKDDANDRAEFDATDITWTALDADATDTLKGVLLYHFRGSDATSVPIAWIEFASEKTADDSDFTVEWHEDGILNFTAG
ncbi:MAG: hypothetical protein JRC53_02070 [Deltaproteobacteria bacterium]|nr:hypothetical protein [Deltaproteobacteria bacterium]